MFQGVIAHRIGAKEIDPENLEGLLGGHFQQGCIGGMNPSVVDQAVDLAKAIDDCCDARGDLLFVGDIAAHRQVLIAQSFCGGLGGIEIPIEDGYEPPFLGEDIRATGADSFGTTCDDDDTLCKSHGNRSANRKVGI
jgi:hypothetical protein